MLAEYITANGLSVWWDHKLEPGSMFSAELKKRIDTASHVIVLWSEHSVASHFVLDEATKARHQNKLVPVRIDDCEVPIGFGQLHVHDVRNWPDDLAPILARVGVEAPKLPPALAKPVRKSRRGAWLAVLGLAILAVAGGGGFLGYRAWQERLAAEESARVSKTQHDQAEQRQAERAKTAQALAQAKAEQTRLEEVRLAQERAARAKQELALNEEQARQDAARRTEFQRLEAMKAEQLRREQALRDEQTRLEAARKAEQARIEQEKLDQTKREVSQMQGLLADCKQHDKLGSARACTELLNTKLSDTTTASVLFSRARSYFTQGEYDRSIADYDQIIRLRPADAAAFSNRGLCFIKKKDYDRAMSDLNRAISLNSNSSAAFSNRGLVHEAKKQFDPAIADFTAAIKLNPQDALAFGNRGGIYFEQKKYQSAIADHGKAIEIEPNNPRHHNNRGAAYSNSGDYKNAITDYRQALLIDPTYTLARENLLNAIKKNNR